MQNWRCRGLGLALPALLWLNGCGPAAAPRSGPGAAPAPSAQRPRIALVMKSLANEFFTTMAEGAKKHQAEHAEQYELIVNGIKDERDLARQVAIVEEMLAQNVAALVIAPADSKALVPVLKRAQDAGVVVINIDNQLDADVLQEAGAQIPFVGPDNRAGARTVGATLGTLIPPDSEVAIIEGVPTAFNAQQRTLGFRDAMQALGMKIVAEQSGQWETDQANRVAAALLTEHPNLRAFLCGNDSMALGALAAVKAAGKSGQVKIVGFDNISAVRAAVQAGEIHATADQHGDQLAVYGIEFALRRLAAAADPQTVQSTPIDLVTADTLK